MLMHLYNVLFEVFKFNIESFEQHTSRCMVVSGFDSIWFYCLFRFEISFISFPRFVINQNLNLNSNSILLCIMFGYINGAAMIGIISHAKYKCHNISTLSYIIILKFQRFILHFCQKFNAYYCFELLIVNPFGNKYH